MYALVLNILHMQVSILAIINLCIYVVLFAHISGVCWMRIKQGGTASSKSKIVHGLLLLFSGCMCVFTCLVCAVNIVSCAVVGLC